MQNFIKNHLKYLSMKKHLNSKLICVTVFTAFISMTSCQKDQEAAETSTSAREVTRISSQAVNGTNIRGLISKETADRMSETFNQTYKSTNSTQYVAFDINDMSNYLQQLKDKYKSDSVYVSFGIYDEKTAVNQTDIGRITVFFMGKNNTKPNGNIRSQSSDSDTLSNYLNHGSIWP